MTTIDINCDLGEGSGNDAAIMPYISSCSIACGGHAGSKATVLESLSLAQAKNVKTGAHPAYEDPENFGRISRPISGLKLQETLRKQLDLFFTLCSDVNHIKPHGALYNDLFQDAEKAEAFIATVAEYDSFTKVYCSPNSALSEAAKKAGMTVVLEGFGDRAYRRNGTLVKRSLPGAVITEKNGVANHALNIILNQTVMSLEDIPIPLAVQTLCMHGDGENVVENLRHLNAVLNKNNVNVAAV